MEIESSDALVAASGMFRTPEELDVPTVTDRYRYKKKKGSSDTNHQKDEFD